MIKKIVNTIKDKMNDKKEDEEEFLLAGDNKKEEKEILKKVVELSNEDQREVIDEYKEKYVN